MRRFLSLLTIGLGIFLVVSAPQARADGVDTFTFTEQNFEGSHLPLTLTWQLPAAPTGLPASNVGIDFETPIVFPVTVTSFGLTENLPDQFVFLNSTLGGGFFDAYGILFSTAGATQFYSGSENTPTFTPGTYHGFDSGYGNSGTLSITTATPEPSALLLLAAGLAAFLFCVTLKKQLL